MDFSRLRFRFLRADARMFHIFVDFFSSFFFFFVCFDPFRSLPSLPPPSSLAARLCWCNLLHENMFERQIGTECNMQTCESIHSDVNYSCQSNFSVSFEDYVSDRTRSPCVVHTRVCLNFDVCTKHVCDEDRRIGFIDRLVWCITCKNVLASMRLKETNGEYVFMSLHKKVYVCDMCAHGVDASARARFLYQMIDFEETEWFGEEKSGVNFEWSRRERNE